MTKKGKNEQSCADCGCLFFFVYEQCPSLRRNVPRILRQQHLDQGPHVVHLRIRYDLPLLGRAEVP